MNAISYPMTTTCDRETQLIETIHILREERDAAVEQLEALKRAFRIDDPDLCLLGLTHTEVRVIGLMRSRGVVNRDQLMTVLYFDRPQDQEPEEKIIDVYVCKARKKLKSLGIDIITNGHGTGWCMPPESKRRLDAVLAERLSL